MKNLLIQRRFLMTLGVVGGLVFLYLCFAAELQTWAYTALTAALILLLVFAWSHEPVILGGWAVAGFLRLMGTYLAAPGTSGVWGKILVLAYVAALVTFWVTLFRFKRLRLRVCVAMAVIFWLRLMQLDPPGPEAAHDGLVLLYALGCFGLFFFGGIGLAAQFVLPVQTNRERHGVFGRMLLYLIGRHGPALSVKCAGLVAASGELKRRGPGLILIDSNSAVALEREPAPPPPPWIVWRKPGPPVRIEGPGLVFTEADEALRAQDLLDLRRQSRSVSGVAGSTRDGLEVVVTLRVTFILSPPRLEASLESHHRPAYPLNHKSAFDAVYGRAASAVDAVRWTDLPLVVAKEVYRDLLSRQNLDQPRDLNTPDTDPLVGLRREFTEQMKDHLLLKTRGIEVVSASISQMSFPKPEKAPGPGVEEQRLENWRAAWQRRELESKIADDVQAFKIKEDARIRAQAEWVTQLTEAIQAPGPHSKQAMALRLFQALEMAASNPSTRRLLPKDAIAMLENVHEWLKVDEKPSILSPVTARPDGQGGPHG